MNRRALFARAAALIAASALAPLFPKATAAAEFDAAYDGAMRKAAAPLFRVLWEQGMISKQTMRAGVSAIWNLELRDENPPMRLGDDAFVGYIEPPL